VTYQRFFAFGCSFTNYIWPTWADLISNNFTEGSYYNYGKQGVGNQYIFNAVMQADQIHKFNENDLVIVQWSSTLREDRYMKGKWVPWRSHYPDFFRDHYFDEKGFLIRDFAFIKAIGEFLKAKCSYKFISMTPLRSYDWMHPSSGYEVFNLINNDLTNVINFYADVLSQFPLSFVEVLGDFGKIRPLDFYGFNLLDNHPVPSEHCKYVKQIFPEFEINDGLVQEYDLKLSNLLKTRGSLLGHNWGIIVNNKELL